MLIYCYFFFLHLLHFKGAHGESWGAPSIWALIEAETDKLGDKEMEKNFVCACVCVCACMRERERWRERRVENALSLPQCRETLYKHAKTLQLRAVLTTFYLCKRVHVCLSVLRAAISWQQTAALDTQRLMFLALPTRLCWFSLRARKVPADNLQYDAFLLKREQE